MLRRSGAHDLGEAGDADAHQLAALALLGLLLAQAGVVDDLHRLLEGTCVVAAVVLPAGGRLVGERLLRDEVLDPELGRVPPQFLGQHVGHALDGVDGLGHAERAAVGDAARGLVGVGAVHLDEAVLEVVRAGADREEPRRELGRVGGGVGVAVVGQRLDAQRRDLAVLVGAELGVDVVVARERVGLQVLHPVLDPLDRLAQHDRRGGRDHVAGVDGHLAAEAAADVGRDDADLLLREPDVAGDQREDRPDRVRGLRRHPDRELAVDPVERGDTAAGLDRGHVDARDVDPLLHHHRGVLHRLVRGRSIARLPVEDVVVLLAGLVGAQHRRAGLERLPGIDHDRQRLVLDLDRGHPVRGR